MLHSDQVGEFLMHENPFVRDHALRSLAMAGAHAGVSADMALAALGKYGLQAFARPEQMTELPMSAAAIEQLITAEGGEACAGEWASRLPQALLKQYAPKFSPALRERVARRLEAGAMEPQTLWGRLVASGEASAEELALVEHDEYVMPRVMAILAKRGDALRPAAIRLGGLCHIGAALPMLLDAFEGDDAEAAIEAVARLGTAGAVSAMELRCARADVAFRRAAAKCLGRIRVPTVESTLQRMILEEDSPLVMAELALALGDICTTGGFDAACALVRSGKIDPVGIEQTKRGLGSLSLMLKRPVKELDAWLGDRPKPQGRFGQGLATKPKESADVPVAMDSFGVAGDDRHTATSPPVVSTIRREEAKVGRNDPCPCGSGKKHKKCCGL